MPGGRDVQPDFEDVCGCFNRHDVDYVIVGSEAVAVHGSARYSLDFDIAIEPSVANARRVFAALAEFGFEAALAGHSPEAWIEAKPTRQLGYLNSLEWLSRRTNMVLLLEAFKLGILRWQRF